MKVGELFKICKVEGYDVVRYFKSPFYLWCCYHAPKEEVDEESDYMKMIAERGKQHEKVFIQQKHPDMIPLKLETTEEILKELKSGVPAFDNLPIFDPNMEFAGKPDLLEISHDAPSKLGKFHYIVKEIKSVKDPTTKKHYIMQTAFYNYILGLLQGYIPKIFYIVNKAGEEVAFNFSDYENELIAMLKEIENIKKGEAVTPTLDTDYPWTKYSEKRALESMDISLVNGISVRMKPKLNQIGIKTVDDLDKRDMSELTTIDGIRDKKAAGFKRSARALIQKKPIIFGKSCLPDKKVEIFFDLESTIPDEELNVTTQINYLFGIIIRENGKEEYIPIAAENLEQEEKILNDFLKIVLKKDDFVIYYFSNFEKRQLTRMFEQYETDEDIKNRIFENSVDLWKIVTSTVTFPTTKNGLKEIANFLGFKWRHKDVNAQESMVWYFDFMENNDTEKMQKIIDYNEDDCRATMLIKDWLKNNT